MELKDYEYRVGKDRFYEVKVICQNCNKEFWHRWTRVRDGKGKFCSRECFVDYVKEHAEKIGKEHAFFSWSNAHNYWVAGWYDKDRKQHRSTKARVLWELAYGDIPKNMIITYKDNDPKNCVLENLIMRSTKENSLIKNGGKTHKMSDDGKKRISILHKGKKLTEEHKRKIGDASRHLWSTGIFDAVHFGENSSRWRGGVPKSYPKEFNEKLKAFIRDRDRYTCTVCKKRLYKSRYAQIHHINGNRNDNNPNNLILVCFDCHIKIHADYYVDNAEILAFRSQLDWNK